jgi:hypothetical protein
VRFGWKTTVDNELKEEVCLWIYNYEFKRALVSRYTFEKENSGYGWPKFAHHDKVYSPNNDFVKDDFLFVCCQVRPIIEHNGLSADFDKKLRMNLFSMYEKGIDEKFTIKVNSEELTVSCRV